jgi:hypothetical protein
MITRDNYEEFFLLYIDNELSVADREAVERFIAHHPDLQKDWKALLHCRLLPDEEIIFPDREALYGIGALKEEDNDFLFFLPICPSFSLTKRACTNRKKTKGSSGCRGCASALQRPSWGSLHCLCFCPAVMLLFLQPHSR